MIRSIGAAAVALVLAVDVAACQPAAEGFSAADRARVEARIAHLDQTISSGNLAGAMDVVPPRLFRAIAQRAGITEEQLRQAMRDVVESQMGGVTIVSYDMDLAAAPPLRTPEGNRTYLLIPTSTVVGLPDGSRVKSSNVTLALQDEGEWYLIRVDDQNQVAILKELWPEFGPVHFPAGKTEPVQ